MSSTRRNVIKTGAAAAAASVAGPWPIARAAETLTVAAYGGEYREIMMRTVIQPFEKKFGVQIVYDDSGGVDPYPRIRASRGAPGFDVAAELVVATSILGAKEKLLEPITEREVPNLKHVWQRSRDLIPPNGVVQSYQYLALMWNKNKLDQPTSWLDYWESSKRYGDKVKGHLATHTPANFTLAAYALIMAARAGGGDERNMDKAWDYLRGIKPDVAVSAASSAQAVPYIENEQIWIMPFWSARAAIYVNRGLPYGMMIPKEGTLALGNTSGIPVGSKNKKLAFEFLNFRLEPEIQHAFCEEYKCSPARPDLTGWSKAFLDQQITTEAQMKALVIPDDEYIAQVQRQWTLKWQEVMS